MSATRSAAEHQKIMDTLTEYLDRKLGELKTQLFTKLETEIADLKKSTQFVSDRYDDINDKLNKILDLPKQQQKIIEEMEKQEKRIVALETKIAVSEQKELKNSVEVNGFKVSLNEPPHEIATRISSAFGLNLEPEDKYRFIKSSDTKPSRLIYTFKDEIKKITMMNFKKNNNVSHLADVNKNIYVNEALTPYYKNLLWTTKIKAKEKKFKYIWFRNGKLLARKSEDSLITEIKNHLDLESKII